MSESPFRGVLPAVVTPLDAEERFAPAPFERLLERVYQAGMHGIYVCGQTGEGLLLPVAERQKVAEAAVRCSPRDKLVIIHVGSHRTADAVQLARHAAACGAHAVSSLPPAGAYSFAEIQAYYRTLAAASDLPLLVYFFPAMCPAITRAGEIIELCSIPNIIGLKFTDFDLHRLALIKQSGAVIFNGRDEIFAAGLLMGADGGIGSFYNLIPELFLQVYDLACAGRWAECRPVQYRINELVEITLRFPAMAAIKTMLRWSGIDCGRCVEPRRWIEPEEEAELQRALAASSFAGAPFAGPGGGVLQVP